MIHSQLILLGIQAGRLEAIEIALQQAMAYSTGDVEHAKLQEAHRLVHSVAKGVQHEIDLLEQHHKLK